MKNFLSTGFDEVSGWGMMGFLRAATPLKWGGLVLFLCMAMGLNGGAFADYLEDVDALTSSPHRLAGTDEGRAAGDYIEGRLRSIGIERVLPLEMTLWQGGEPDGRPTLEVSGGVLELEAMRPNLIAPPVTPAEGITGSMVYVGDGTLTAYGKRDPQGAIVVINYDSGDRWEQAFALGASAVVFLGDGAMTPREPRSANVPRDLPRFYVTQDEASAAGLDLTADHDSVTLKSSQPWQRTVGRNLIAVIPGTDTRFENGSDDETKQREVLVVSAGYDSYGNVPRRSPAARRAANVAGLLALAEQLHDDPPKRDVVLMFLDDESRRQHGSRSVYDAWMMKGDEHLRLVASHDAEAAWVEQALKGLQDEGAQSSDAAKPLRQQADWARADLNLELQVIRRQWRRGDAPDSETQQSVIDDFQSRIAPWDDVRRALHRGEPSMLSGVEQGVLDTLVQATAARLQSRLVELDFAKRVDQQRTAIREALRDDGEPAWVVLHASMDLSDGGSVWSAVASGSSVSLYGMEPKTEADGPGYYGPLLNALARVGTEVPEQERSALSLSVLRDPSLADRFTAAPIVHGGEVAGAYQFFNVALVNGYDARPRDGHPADTAEALDLDRMQRFTQEASALLRAAADEPALRVNRAFNAVAMSKHPGWEDGRGSGSLATLRVTGGLSENRPAAGAMLATWPGSWDITESLKFLSKSYPADYDPVGLSVVNGNGRFLLVSMREDIHRTLATVGAMFDDRGGVVAVPTKATSQQSLLQAMRVDLFSGQPRGATWVSARPGEAGMFTLLRANSDTTFRENLALAGSTDRQRFFYVAERAEEPRVKLFEPWGLVGLGVEADGDSVGLPIEMFERPVSLAGQSAADLWTLNEKRLSGLRTRGVGSPDLEVLHASAGRLYERAEESATLAQREAGYQRSLLLSERVYPTLRKTMDDLVHAVVLLLLLTIPFAFALERLLVGASSVYGRIVGFVAMFGITFAMLYWMHPGFAIASTPIIIFLAFAILILSALVIFILVRKFQTELKAMQAAVGMSGGGASETPAGDATANAPGGGGHDLEVSQLGTMMAAIGMGISTMRRRPTRTTLTATTVVMLTFTILCFASFTREVGVKSTPLGPTSEAMPGGTAFLRQLDHSQLNEVMLDVVEAGGHTAVGSWWRLSEGGPGATALTVARQDDDRVRSIDAVMGLSELAVEKWPALGASLGGEEGAGEKRVATLAQRGVWLPAGVAADLELAVGDAVLIGGCDAWYAGPIDVSAVSGLKELDGGAVLPIDAEEAAQRALQSGAQGGGDDSGLIATDVAGEAVYLSAGQVAIAGDVLVKELGGSLRTVRVYPAEAIGPVSAGRELAELLPMPVWSAGPSGVQRMILTRLTSLSGGLQLVVPLLLGGLIIFGTLLGSIADREKEVYTFSALGLAPRHVGVLFFAEAAVYAVVGGMGGQLLAQTVALFAGWMAEWGWIRPANINFSSTNALFAIAVVMLTVLVSAIYPAIRASRSANPGLARAWKMPGPDGDDLRITFPFTVSAYDITGVVSFLAEHFRAHDDAGLGEFAASDVLLDRDDEQHLALHSRLALAPFDLGVTQSLTLTALPSEIPGVDEVAIHARRLSGTKGDWVRANRVFTRDLRKQFLLWRTLNAEQVEFYRMKTLQAIGDQTQAS